MPQIKKFLLIVQPGYEFEYSVITGKLAESNIPLTCLVPLLEMVLNPTK